MVADSILPSHRRRVAESAAEVYPDVIEQSGSRRTRCRAMPPQISAQLALGMPSPFRDWAGSTLLPVVEATGIEPVYWSDRAPRLTGSARRADSGCMAVKLPDNQEDREVYLREH